MPVWDTLRASVTVKGDSAMQQQEQQKRYYGPFILMNHPDGSQRFTPARKDDYGHWVPLTPTEIATQSR